MLLNDLCQDQIMKPSSRTWTQIFGRQLRDKLAPFGWIQTQSNPTIFLNNLTNQLLIIYPHHHLPQDLDPGALVITDLVVRNHPNKILKIYPESYGHFYNEFEYYNQIPTKKFNCFINRGCSFRQSWIYQLHRNHLLDQGYVSYWCGDRFNKTPPEKYFEELFKQNNQVFEKEHIELRGKIPFKNFTFSLEDAILDSALSLVIETFFDNNQYNCFSEKTWRVIQLPRPWVMFNSMHSIKHLRDCGFDVLDDYVDHGYDSESDPIARQMMILEQVKKNIILTKDNLEDLEKRAQHNRLLLKKLKNEWPARVEKIISEVSNYK